MSGTDLQPQEQAADLKPAVDLLNPSELRVLLVLADPRKWHWTLDKKVTASGLSKAQFCRLRKSPRVLEACAELVDIQFGASLPAVAKATVESALILGRDGHNDRKMIFEMTGRYSRYGKRAPAPGDDEAANRLGRQIGAGLADALQSAQRESAKAAAELAQSEDVQFEGGGDVIEADFDEEPTTSGDDDPSDGDDFNYDD